jgi:uncharacterized membrane protein
MPKVVFLSLLVILTAVLCVAQENYTYLNGNRLLDKCDAESSLDRGFCMGYVAAAMDGQVTLAGSLQAASEHHAPIRMYCLPKGGIEVGQAVRVTVKWLHDHPDKLHIPGDVLVIMALTDGFPCK